MPRPLNWTTMPGGRVADAQAQRPHPPGDTSLVRLTQTTVTREARWASTVWALLALCGGMALAMSLF